MWLVGACVAGVAGGVHFEIFCGKERFDRFGTCIISEKIDSVRYAIKVLLKRPW